MSITRRIGAGVAIGALTAGLALLSGVPAPRADELADLRANQELLQRRIDQLAQLTSKPQPGAPTLAGSFPRSFLIPGTDTSISIRGNIWLDAAYWLSGGPPNGNVQVPTAGNNGQALAAPLDLHGTGFYAPPTFNPHSRGNGVFQMTARRSRLRVETRTPTAWGPAETVMEFDWAGCNNLSCSGLNHVSNNIVPRLRYAYGVLGPWLAGQAAGNTTDGDADPETLDFGGDVGSLGMVRLPQLRYTLKGPRGTTWSFSADAPQTDVFTPAGQIATDLSATPAVDGVGVPVTLAVNPAKSSMPDWTAVARWDQPWGHLALQAILRDLRLQDGRFIDREYIGYGGGFSGNVKPGWLGWSKDNIVFVFRTGEGLGRYLNSNSNSALATNFGGTGLYGSVGGPITRAASRMIHATTVTNWGGKVGYQHFFANPQWRANASFGIQHQDVPSLLVGPSQSITAINKEVVTGHFNVIWSPVSFVDIGLEYMWGHRVTVGNAKGDENEIQGTFLIKF